MHILIIISSILVIIAATINIRIERKLTKQLCALDEIARKLLLYCKESNPEGI